LNSALVNTTSVFHSNPIDEPRIGIVIPIYKSEAHITVLLSAITGWAKNFEPSVGLILVDDGSKDQSLPVAEEFLKTQTLPYTLLRLKENCGQHTALAVGLHYCETEWMVTMDDDLQHLPEYIPLLWECAQRTHADLVYGFHKQSNHAGWRNLASSLARFITKTIIYDYTKVTSFRLIHRRAAEHFKLKVKSSFFIDPNLIQAADNVQFTPVPHHKKASSKSRYSLSKLLGMTFKIWLSHSPIRTWKLVERNLEPKNNAYVDWFSASQNLEMLPLAKHHIQMVREWRNSDFVNREMDYRSQISPEQQEQWFANLDPHKNHYFIFRYKGDWIGLSHIHELTNPEDIQHKSGENGGFLKSADLKGSGLSIIIAIFTLDFAFKFLMMDRLTIKVHKQNRAAIELNEALGYTCTGSLSEEFIGFELLAENYLKIAPRLRKLLQHL